MTKTDYIKPKAVDLFSGCGGLTQGLKEAGFEVIGAVEIEPVAGETYNSNHPEVNLWVKDIKSLSGKEILKTLQINEGELDLLAGCPPCQGFSSMRTLNGKKSVEDPRNELLFEFLRLVKQLLPKVVMMENVPALAKDNRMVQFKTDLQNLGYNCNGFPQVLNVAKYGVPQRRKRMIFLGSRIGRIELEDVDFHKVTVRDAISGLKEPASGNDPLHDYKENRTEQVSKIISLIPKDGGSRRNLPEKYQLECHKKCKGGFKDVYGRMKWDEVSPTITGGCISPSKGRFLHPEQNRAITLREAALLQTFPSNYYFSLKSGRQSVALMIGNALPPKFIKIHAEEILNLLNNSNL